MRFVFGFLFLFVGTICLGMLLFFVSRSLIIIRWPMHTYSRDEHKLVVASYKKVICTCWKTGAYIPEERVLVGYDSMTKNLTLLVKEWLSFSQSEHVVNQDVVFQDCSMVIDKKTVLLSFSHNIFNQNASIQEKTHIVFSLFKTIRDSGILISAAMILVNHLPMSDDHLDFSFPWPMDGFVRI